jgi:hypothetical protein
MRLEYDDFFQCRTKDCLKTPGLAIRTNHPHSIEVEQCDNTKKDGEACQKERTANE